MNAPEHTPNTHEHLRQRIAEDIGAVHDEATLLAALTALRDWEAPPTPPEKMTTLLAALTAELPSSDQAGSAPRHADQARGALSWSLRVLLSQIRVVQGTIWTASALVMLLGTLVTLGGYTHFQGEMLPLAILAPVAATVGLALLYDSDIAAMLELENSTRVSARLLLLARLTLVFGFNLVLGLIGSVVLVLTHRDLVLWGLVLSWLGPMTFLSALAFFLSVVSIAPMVGMIISLFLWVVHLLLRMGVSSEQLWALLALPGLSAASSRPALFAAAGVLCAAAVWIAGLPDQQEGTYLA